MGRRPDGSLEAAVLDVLWAADGPLPPAEVNQRLGQGHAYTSVATVLTRLHAKGLVQREATGRAYAYAPAVAETELAVRRIEELLDRTSDRSAVLARFVGSLSTRDARTLRRLLDGDDS